MLHARIDTISHLDVHQTRPLWLNAFLPSKKKARMRRNSLQKVSIGLYQYGVVPQI